MIGSVTGQNVYSAQYAAYQRPSVQDNDQDGSWGSINGTFGSSGMGGPTGVGGAIRPMLSDGMSFALLASTGTGSASQASGQSTGASSASQAGLDQGGDLSKLLPDLESLLSSFGGTATNSTTDSTGTTTASAGDASSIGNTGTASSTDIASRLMQDLQALANDLGTAGAPSEDMASLNSRPPSAPAGGPPPPPPWNNDMVNTGTATAEASGGSSSVSGTQRNNAWQQFMLSAHAWGADRAASSSAATVTV